MNDREAEYISRHYGQLVGAIITDVGVLEDDFDESLWPVLFLEKRGERLRVEVSRDGEGNGPGHLFIGKEE